MNRDEKRAALQHLNAEQLPIVIANSKLHEGTKQAVPGDGNPDADILIIGEAPGKKEDETGVPFVGAAGKLLTLLLESIGMKREDIFIANVIKHRPPDNRDPIPSEIAVYAPWLAKQIEIIDPKIIITLGRFSMDFMLGSGFSISQIHGQPREKNGRVILPLYHPAAALYSGKLRPVLFEDFQKIPKILALIGK
ncbi:MAG: uracil-DNA glycosylase [bacterium]|nr:uracil-DNA glycosylase [bacterium]